MQNSAQDFVSRFTEKLISNGLLQPNQAEGCTEAELNESMKLQSVDFLPRVYREFMLRLGKNTETLFQGEDFDCFGSGVFKDHLLSEIAFTECEIELPKNAFIFMMHHGYIGWYFLCSESDDDPLVFICNPDECRNEKMAPLTVFLQDYMDEIIAIRK